MTKRTFTSLMKRVTAAGFPAAVVRRAVLPDWWDDSCAKDPALLADVEFRVARFLGVPLEQLHGSSAALAVPSYPGAKLRKVKNIATVSDPAIRGAGLEGAVRRAGRH